MQVFEPQDTGARPGLEDLLVFCGLCLMGTGLWFFDWRVSLMVVGVLSFGLGVAITFRRPA